MLNTKFSEAVAWWQTIQKFLFWVTFELSGLSRCDTRHTTINRTFHVIISSTTTILPPRLSPHCYDGECNSLTKPQIHACKGRKISLDPSRTTPAGSIVTEPTH